jgi:Cu(I)/Ag(I) efflux system membrane fusion protein
MSSTPSAPAPRRTARLAVQMALVRLRFPLVLAGALAVVACWPALRAHWDRWTGPGRAPEAVSQDTEYWCPMCPGVVSDWPGKCPVCNMALVRRKKGEAVPLPDGVLCRMQLSPYRVQLAGVQTSPLEYLALAREVVLTGFVAPPDGGGPPGPPHPWVKAEAFESDLPFLREGQAAGVTSDLLPGQPPLPARVRKVGPALAPVAGTAPVWLELEGPAGELRPGALVTARVESPAAEQDWYRLALTQGWQRQAAAEAVAQALLRPAAVPDPSAAGSLLRRALPQVFLHRGLVPAVPESAVVDHGTRKVAYVESMPGTFDGVAVTVGPRCGDHYPVLAGLEPGQRLATAGAFLLDAEARLNPALAAGYFGASRGGSAPAATAAATRDPAGDRELIARQKMCPVTGADLDSMGGPVRLEVAGRVVFICCEGCEAALRKDPDKYLSRLPGK